MIKACNYHLLAMFKLYSVRIQKPSVSLYPLLRYVSNLKRVEAKTNLIIVNCEGHAKTFAIAMQPIYIDILHTPSSFLDLKTNPNHIKHLQPL